MFLSKNVRCVPHRLAREPKLEVGGKQAKTPIITSIESFELISLCYGSTECLCSWEKAKATEHLCLRAKAKEKRGLSLVHRAQ